MLSLLSPWPWLALALAVLLGGLKGYDYGNRFGAYAKAYRAVAAELAQKNGELSALKARDEREIPKENTARDVATENAAAALKNLGSCPVSKAQAELLNKIGD